VFVLCLLLCGGRAACAQENKPAELDPVAAAKIVRIVLRAEFKPGSEARDVYLSDRFIERAWLPVIENVSFTVIDDAEFKRRGKAYFFKEPVVDKGLVRIDFGYGDDCSAQGASYFFEVTGTRVHRILDRLGGWGSNCDRIIGTADSAKP
jgi:hypothetical protein